MTHEKERQEEILLHNDISRLREDDEQIDLARDDSWIEHQDREVLRYDV